MHKGIPRFLSFKTFMWYIIIVGWETCDLQLTCNWFNQNIKSFNNVNFYIKSLILSIVFLFSSCKISMATNHSSSWAFNSINDTHWKKVLSFSIHAM